MYHAVHIIVAENAQNFDFFSFTCAAVRLLVQGPMVARDATSEDFYSDEEMAAPASADGSADGTDEEQRPSRQVLTAQHAGRKVKVAAEDFDELQGRSSQRGSKPDALPGLNGQSRGWGLDHGEDPSSSDDEGRPRMAKKKLAAANGDGSDSSDSSSSGDSSDSDAASDSEMGDDVASGSDDTSDDGASTEGENQSQAEDSPQSDDALVSSSDSEEEAPAPSPKQLKSRAAFSTPGRSKQLVGMPRSSEQSNQHQHPESSGKSAAKHGRNGQQTPKPEAVEPAAAKARKAPGTNTPGIKTAAAAHKTPASARKTPAGLGSSAPQAAPAVQPKSAACKTPVSKRSLGIAGWKSVETPKYGEAAVSAAKTPSSRPRSKAAAAAAGTSAHSTPQPQAPSSTGNTKKRQLSGIGGDNAKTPRPNSALASGKKLKLSETPDRSSSAKKLKAR